MSLEKPKSVYVQIKGAGTSSRTVTVYGKTVEVVEASIKRLFVGEDRRERRQKLRKA